MIKTTSGEAAKQATLKWAATALEAGARGRLEIEIAALEFLRVFPVIQPVAGLVVTVDISAPQPETDSNLEIVPRLVLLVENTTEGSLSFEASEINLRGAGPAPRPAGHTREAVAALTPDPGPFEVTSHEDASVPAVWTPLASVGGGSDGGDGGDGADGGTFDPDSIVCADGHVVVFDGNVVTTSI